MCHHLSEWINHLLAALHSCRCITIQKILITVHMLRTLTLPSFVCLYALCSVPIRSIDSIGLQLWKAPSLGPHWCLFFPGNSTVFSYSQQVMYSGNVQFSCSCTMKEHTCDSKDIGGLLVNPGAPGLCTSRSSSTRGHHDRQVLTSWGCLLIEAVEITNHSREHSVAGTYHAVPLLYEVIFIMQQEWGQTVLPWHNYTAALQVYADKYH